MLHAAGFDAYIDSPLVFFDMLRGQYLHNIPFHSAIIPFLFIKYNRLQQANTDKTAAKDKKSTNRKQDTSIDLLLSSDHGEAQRILNEIYKSI